jgi:hypothetical protein
VKRKRLRREGWLRERRKKEKKKVNKERWVNEGRNKGEGDKRKTIFSLKIFFYEKDIKKQESSNYRTIHDYHDTYVLTQ